MFSVCDVQVAKSADQGLVVPCSADRVVHREGQWYNKEEDSSGKWFQCLLSVMSR